MSLTEERLAQRRALYPNPVSDELRWDNPLPEQQNAVLYSPEGRKRATITLPKNSTGMSVSHLPKGLYFL